MKKNIGTKDKIIRVCIGVAALVGIVFVEDTLVQGILLVLSIIALGTAAIGWCGLYRLLGINTCKVQ